VRIILTKQTNTLPILELIIRSSLKEALLIADMQIILMGDHPDNPHCITPINIVQVSNLYSYN